MLCICNLHFIFVIVGTVRIPSNYGECEGLVYYDRMVGLEVLMACYEFG